MPASAAQPAGTRSKESWCAVTAEMRQKPLSAAVARLWPALSPSPILTHRPDERPSVVKSSVVDCRPLPPAVTAAKSPLAPSKPTWRTVALTGIGAVSAVKVVEE